MASSCLSNLEQVDIFNEVENLQAIVLWMVLIMSHTTPISFTKFLKVNSVMKKMNTKSDPQIEGINHARTLAAMHGTGAKCVS